MNTMKITQNNDQHELPNSDIILTEFVFFLKSRWFPSETQLLICVLVQGKNEYSYIKKINILLIKQEKLQELPRKVNHVEELTEVLTHYCMQQSFQKTVLTDN